MDGIIDIESLEEMKYAEMRKLAKSVGIKANMKAEKLLQALKKYAAESASGQVDSAVKAPTQEVCVKKTLTPSVKKTLTPSVRKTLTPSVGSTRSPHILHSAGRSTPLSLRRTPSQQRLGTPTNKLATPTRHTPVCESSASGGRKRKMSNAPCNTSRPGSAAKRQRLESPSDPNKNVDTPSSAAKRRSRSNSYTLDVSEVSCPKPHVSSPSTQDLLDSVHHSQTMSDGEIRDRLMQVIDKKVQDKLETTGTTKVSQIPRFAAFAARKKSEAANKTPNQLRWTKIHARNFEKMDSIDTYLEKKKKRTEQITSVKKAQDLAEQVRCTMEHLKKSTKKSANPTQDSPAAKSRTMLFKSPAHSGVPFVPRVTSTSKASFNFAETSKTPKEKSMCTKENKVVLENPTVDEHNKKTALSRKSTGSTPGKESVTPFKFNATANETKPLSCQKAKFDLAESLTKKPTWKPHKGKLKPFVFGTSHEKDVKAVKVMTKAERRRQEHVRRTNRRAGVHMTRRGLNA